MNYPLEADTTEFFHASSQDFRAQVAAGGWSFWRGMIVGFAAAFPLAYLAANGEFFPGFF